MSQRSSVRLCLLAAVAVCSPAVLVAAPPSSCSMPADQRLVEFASARIEESTRCLVAPLVAAHTTTGMVGPVETPVGVTLYEYLLDRPVITAALVERLGIGTYRFTPKGPGRFWVEDGDGTEALLTLVFQDGGRRIYYLEGTHHGHIFTVHATAVVFMTLRSTEPPAGVNTSLVSFARIDDRFFAGLVWLLRPLLEDAITQKLTRGFQATTELGWKIAQEPAFILEQARSLPFDNEEELSRFTALLPAHSTPVR